MAFLCASVSLGIKTPLSLFPETTSNTLLAFGVLVLIPTEPLFCPKARVHPKKIRTVLINFFS